MNSNASDLLRVLPYAGVMPFVGGALLLLFGVDHVPSLGTVQPVIFSYGLTIVSFMAGVHWGQHVSGARTGVNLLAMSNGVALAGWFGYWLLPASYFCLLLIALFLVLLWVDTHLRGHNTIDAKYVTTRTVVTAIVCASLMVVACA
jgi:Protein of unknown function (DUF3429)